MKRNLKSTITKQEDKILQEIDAINIKKNIVAIMKNPEEFFEPYLRKLQSPLSIIFGQFSVLMIIKEADGNGKLCYKTADYFLKRYSIERWLDTLIQFYQYTLTLINHLLDNHDNSVLDMYNNGRIDKGLMEKGMRSFAQTKKELINDKQEIEKCIEDIEEEKEHIGKFQD